jgi:hypothetical protein
VHALEAAKLAQRLRVRFRGQSRLGDLHAVLVQLLDARVGLAELGLDRAELLAQEVLALVAVDLLLGLGLDLRLDRGHLELAAQDRVHAPQPRQRVERLQHLLRVRQAQAQVRGHQVREAAGLLHVRRHREHLGRQVLQREELLHARAHRAHDRLGLDAPGRVLVCGERRHARPGRRVGLDEALHARLAEGLEQRLHAAVRQAQRAGHHRHGAHAVEVVGPGLVELAVALRHEEHQPVPGERVLERRDGSLAGHEERHHHVREDHELPEREQRQLLGDLEAGVRARHRFSLSTRRSNDLRRGPTGPRRSAPRPP